VNKSSVLIELKQYAKAVETCNRALAIKPNDFSALVNKGIALDELNQYEAASNIYIYTEFYIK